VIIAPPTVIDLEADGQLETIVGTAAGSIYVIDSHGARFTYPLFLSIIDSREHQNIKAPRSKAQVSIDWMERRDSIHCFAAVLRPSKEEFPHCAGIPPYRF